MSTSGVWFVRAYVDLVGGDVLAALMLSQIAYWNSPDEDGKSRLRVNRKGTYWLSKSAAQWGEELGCTPKQAYRCISVLVKKGLIVTDTMKFDGTPTIHSRLTPHGREALKHPHGNSQMASKENSFAPEEKSLTETTTKSTTEIDPAGEPAEAVNPKEQSGKDYEEGKEIKEKKSENGIGKLWKEQLNLRYPGYHKELTKKEYGQLKQFKNKLGIEAEEALCFAIDNWWHFSMKAKKDKGAQYLPEKPVIGFLLKYCDVLAALMNEVEEKNAEMAAYKAKIASEPVKHSPLLDPPAKFTPEEIAADLAFFKTKY